jgi:membrane-anchored glycerophosphoryl diester phosphodiesterase (GDPDase)
MKFSMSEAWREATAMMSGNREVLLVVAGLFFLLPSLVLALVMPGLQESMIADPEHAQARVLELYANWWWLMLLVVLAQIVGYLALLALLRDTSRPTVGEALKAGLTGLLPAIGFYLIVGAGAVVVALVVVALTAASPGIGVIVALVCVVVAIYLMIKLCLVLPIIAIDKVSNPISAISRSWQLTKGNSLRLFLFFVLLFLVYLVISMVVGMIVAAVVLAAGTSTALLVNGIVSGILGAGLTVVLVAVIAAIHRQLSGPSAAAVSETFE